MAIVGRPNVGKSLLFNRLAERKNAAIVEDTPGVTRDRIYARAEWRGRAFDIIDTGGIEPKTDNEILRFMREQAYIAISHAEKEEMKIWFLRVMALITIFLER